MDGIDLFEAMQEINIVTNEQAMFYMGNLILAMEHLAEQNVVHRDLKPENIMIDAEGYICLQNFQVAKIIKDRTFTILGTPYYMAPEVIMGKGYSASCDLWSLGVILYEMVCAELPFGENCHDPQDIYHAVIFDRLMFPMNMSWHPAIDMIKQLLNRQPSRRGIPSSLKNHEWFKIMNWEDLYYRAIKPEYTPTLVEITSSHPLKGSVQEIILNDELQESIRTREGVKTGWDKLF